MLVCKHLAKCCGVWLECCGQGTQEQFIIKEMFVGDMD